MDYFNFFFSFVLVMVSGSWSNLQSLRKAYRIPEQKQMIKRFPSIQQQSCHSWSNNILWLGISIRSRSWLSIAHPYQYYFSAFFSLSPSERILGFRTDRYAHTQPACFNVYQGAFESNNSTGKPWLVSLVSIVYFLTISNGIAWCTWKQQTQWSNPTKQYRNTYSCNRSSIN